MGVRNLSGTPWHVEKMTRKDGEDRRDKRRCEFYAYNENFCRRRNGKCIGSAHCSDYAAISEEAFKQRQNQRKKPKTQADNDVYWF